MAPFVLLCLLGLPQARDPPLECHALASRYGCLRLLPDVRAMPDPCLTLAEPLQQTAGQTRTVP